jgi:hypothetical protein
LIDSIDRVCGQLEEGARMADPETHVPNGEKPEGEKPRLEYEIIPTKREEPKSEFTAAGRLQSAIAEALSREQASADQSPPPPEEPSPTEAAPVQAPPAEAASRGISKLIANPTRLYAAIGIGLGLLVGFAIAAFFIHPPNQYAPTDLGSITAAPYGLKGELTVKWTDKLAYHLTIEPSAPEQRAAFIAAVGSSPRPLSIDVQLKDPFGVALCGNTILLKYDPRNAPLPAEPKSAGKTGKAAESNAQKEPITQSTYLAQLVSRELSREHGRDIFQNDVGPDGKIASISAQGTMPCSKKQFDDTAAWGFTSNFPVVVSPDAGRDSSADQSAAQAAAAKAADTARTVARNKRRAMPPISPIHIEGDDQIIWFDAATGTLQTRAGKTLVIDKTDAVANALKGRDLPIAIHYTCDATGGCTFAGVGNLTEHARLRR